MHTFLRETLRAAKRKTENLLPFQVSMFVGFVYGIMQKTTSYSQYGEDIIIDCYFNQRGIDKGVYVDIGCYHPTWLSNTYILHKKGWNGYAIDIDKTKLRYFRLLRGRKCKTFFGAITDKADVQSEIELYKFSQAYSSIDTLDKITADKMKEQSGIPYMKVRVPTISLNQLLAKVGKINFLNIDIEGLDEVVLLNTNINIASPEVIVFEDNVDRGGSEKVRRYLSENGYGLLFTSGGSAGYAKL
jgi:FkbM family methyltransferase